MTPAPIEILMIEDNEGDVFMTFCTRNFSEVTVLGVCH